MMGRREFVLAGMRPANRKEFTPVQIQKMFFLIQELARGAHDLGLANDQTHFDFVPYHYGPFDKEVYAQIESLRREGLAAIGMREPRIRTYCLTPAGQDLACSMYDALDQSTQRFLSEVSTWVLEQNFNQLVKAVYAAYPHMAANSVLA